MMSFVASENTLPFAASTAVVIATALAYFFFGNRKDEKRMPVAPTGMFENVVWLGGHEAPFWVLKMARRMNTMNFRLRLPGLYANVIGDHRVVREILKDPKTDKPREVYRAFEGTASKTMFTSSNKDPYMKSLRKSTAHAFSKNEVGRMNAVASKYVDQWMNGRLKNFAETGQPFDPAKELNLITFLVICEAAFEFQATKEDYEFYGHHSEIYLTEFIGKSSLNPLRSVFGTFIPAVREARQSLAKIMDFAGRVLEKYRKSPHKFSNKTLIKILNENVSIADDFQRKSEIKDWLTAGHDTTGYSLANTLTLLAKHPEAQNKLREALLKCNDSSPEDCDYFRNVLKESMRVMPVAAGGSVRVTGRDFHVEGGKALPKGSICFFNQYLMNRNPSVYDNPDSFVPERWENPNEDMKVAMTPFALGPRACPGQPLALSEINMALPRILTQYSFELVDEGRPTFFLTLKYNGTKLKAKKL